jgi:hypothetical protein
METLSKTLRRFSLLGVFLFLVTAVLPTDGRAEPYTYGFARITRNSPADVASQFSVSVTDERNNQVGFKFTNAVGTPSSITDIYFDDGALFEIASITSSPGVAFSRGARPPNLPGGNALDPVFETTAGFLADSDCPIPENGVDAAVEWVQIIFSLQSGKYPAGRAWLSLCWDETAKACVMAL